VDIVDDKLEAAKKFGATHTINASAVDPVQKTRKLTDGALTRHSRPSVIRNLDQIIQATRPGGTATIIGGLGNGPFTISSGRFVTSEITITGVSSGKLMMSRKCSRWQRRAGSNSRV